MGQGEDVHFLCEDCISIRPVFQCFYEGSDSFATCGVLLVTES